jgi:hypothetical protein
MASLSCSKRTFIFSWAPISHTCNLGRLRSGRSWSEASLGNCSRDSHLQNNQSKMDWRHSLSGRAPALQSQSSKFKPSHKREGNTIFGPHFLLLPPRGSRIPQCECASAQAPSGLLLTKNSSAPVHTYPRDGENLSSC